MRRRHDGTRREPEPFGYATVWALLWATVLAMVGLICVALALAAAAQHRADGAADLASISAAARLQHGGDACGTAARIARANSTRLLACAIEDRDVVVTVEAALGLPFGLRVRLSGEARAGPG
jgi:secretion/DNA translocation related TadE-like protein